MRYCLGSLLLLGIGALSAPLTLYVSTDGNDDWSGGRSRPNWRKTDGPFATLVRARNEIRRMKATDAIPEDGVVVMVRRGVYELEAPFTLTEEDSGTARQPVVYRAYRNENVRLSGGRVIRELSPVEAPAAIQRLDESARGQVWKADLAAAGITDFGTAGGGGLEVFVNDEPMPLSRYPNDGFITITKESERDPKNVRGTKGSTYGEIWFQDERAARWTEEPDLWAHGYWFWDWSEQRHKVKELDPDNGRMLFEEPHHGYGYRRGQWFYVYNALSEIDRPGEWHLDRTAGILSIWLPTTPRNARLMVSVLPTVIDMNEVEHVTLDGFTIEGARGTAVIARNVHHVTVQRCLLRNIGGWAVRMSGANSAVIGCDMTNMGSGGIALSGGDRPSLTKANLLAENNHIHHYARWTRVYQPGIQLSGVGQIARHNLIHNAPHMGVGFGGNDHLIEFNEIHSVCYESNDAGAIYTGRDWTQRGTVIRHNYLHHINGFRGRGCVGIYLDDMYSGTAMVGNVFYKVTRATFIGGGRDNLIENNLFIDCEPAVHVDARAVGWAKAAVDGVMKQRLENSPYKSEPWRERWPELLTIMDDEPGLPKGNRIVRNVSVGGRWDGIRGNARPHCIVEDNLVDQDPGFVDADRQDWRLVDDSPVYETIDFKPIPIADIGLYDDPRRACWPVKHTVRPLEGPMGGKEAAAPSERPRHTVRRVKPTAVTIDGRTDDWDLDPEAAITCTLPAVGAASHYETQAWTAFDGADLYLLVRTRIDPDVPLTVGQHWGQEDAVECAFKDASRKNAPIFNIRAYASGHTTSVGDAGAPAAAAQALGDALELATAVHDDHWIAEWRIPLHAAGIDPAALERLDFNLNVRRMADRTWMVWTRTLGPIWQVNSGGILILREASD